MTTPGDPNEPREGQDPRQGGPSEGRPEGAPPPHEPEWWNEGTLPDDERPSEPPPHEHETPSDAPGQTPSGVPEERPHLTPADIPGERPDGTPHESPGVEEPIAPMPPVVPRPDVPPTHEPRPADEPAHPDLPTAPETPEPRGSDAEETQVYQIPGATPSYPGWGGTPEDEEGRQARQQPSRYEQGEQGEQGDQPYFAPPAETTPWQEGRPPQGAAAPYRNQPDTPPQGSAAPYPNEADTPPHGIPAPYPMGTPPQGGATPYQDRGQDATIPGTTPSSPYGGPPGYPPPPPPGAPYGHSAPPYGDYGQYQQSRPGSGLATASLVLGVASPFLVFVCFTGLITAVLSIVFGWVALVKRAGKGRAIAGIVISALSLVLFAIVAIWFWNVVQECAHLQGPLADRCFEQKFPWMSGTR
ncbi:hypothetical protein AB0I81_50505 [Nonomuraea sp. NPDC050404]|uniref:DUF4190 domain-containing protein n=1 Tax=Nonomuraea sp. NPDC050404 TaxID=3155783 RepID=UPI0033EAFB06